MAHVKTLPVGAELRNLRRERWLTQADLAAELGVSLRTVQNWEAGQEPSLGMRRTLARWVNGCDIEDAA